MTPLKDAMEQSAAKSLPSAIPISAPWAGSAGMSDFAAKASLKVFLQEFFRCGP
jgi:hypothetical protein